MTTLLLAASQGLGIGAGTFVVKGEGAIKEKYKITSCIGRGKFNCGLTSLTIGAYGEVRKCYNRENGALRAVKIINKKYLEEDEKAKLLNEVEVLR